MIDLEFMEVKGQISKVRILRHVGMRLIRAIYHEAIYHNLDLRQFEVKCDPVSKVIILRFK